ncbi:LamG domain-containing protein [Olivibacter sp. SDN3]|uniref:LamG domain-containing protein n=1 Tax=Olivibacter sp. SDN3 TaxID=2764720 RepID=UPI0016511F6B|nr:LamG domain-containing protein [Olivibacter sp. SDN3]QNL48102.1 LamG domain-containing protein [Olivibacter sp. SDN3]
MKKIFTYRIILSTLLMSAAALTGCDRQLSELTPSIKLEQGLVYHFPFDGNSTNLINNEHYEIINDSYSADRFGEANKALSLGCKCGPSKGLSGVDIGLGKEEGATSVWVNFNSFNDSDHPLFFKGDQYNELPASYYIFATIDGAFFFYRDDPNNDEKAIITEKVFEPKKWHHILFRWSDSKKIVEIFVDGIIVGSEAYATATPNDREERTDIAYGERNGYGFYYQGKMDDLRVYDRWLNDDEVAALAQ